MRPTNYIRTEGDRIEICLDVLFKKEGGSFVSYAPALELSGCGRDFDEARKSFEIVLREYVRYTRENGTLEADLLRHNWKKEFISKREVYTGLDFTLLLASNEQAKSMTRGNFEKRSERITVTS